MAKLKSTNGEYPLPVPGTRWVGTLFFIVIHLVGFIGTPVYLARHGASAGEWVLFAVYFVCTSMAITVGYHRLFAHVSFKASPLIRFFLLFFGAATFEQSALKWASQHRQHHTNSRTPTGIPTTSNGGSGTRMSGGSFSGSTGSTMTMCPTFSAQNS
jgi:fatty-acid desaturase